MAPRTIVFAALRIHNAEVISASLCDALPNLDVARRALQLRASYAKGMAVRTTQRPFKSAVRLRQCTRRQLRL
jgi:hypothetical protein